ncbi:MAG: 23S rRNA (guanosine(2251)-2'-O)-methyltransferase RlmB [Candidatus Binatia bacterium]
MTRLRTTEPLVVYGANAVAELLRSDTPVTRLHVGPGPRADELHAAARARHVPVTSSDREALVRLAGTPHHQGAVAIAAPYRYRALADVLAAQPASLLVLDGIQDPRNLGAILRTARAAGVGGVVLPKDRCVGVTPVVVSASAGLLFGLAIAQVPNLVRAIEALKGAGHWLVAMVQGAGQDVLRFAAPPRPAIVVGGEGSGIRPLVRRHCDFEVGIPMAPGVESLNVAVATGIVLYEVLWRGAAAGSPR